jgi:hypothetical protein
MKLKKWKRKKIILKTSKLLRTVKTSKTTGAATTDYK